MKKQIEEKEIEKLKLVVDKLREWYLYGYTDAGKIFLKKQKKLVKQLRKRLTEEQKNWTNVDGATLISDLIINEIFGEKQ